MKEKEAKDKAKEKNDTFIPDWFCPLISKKCDKDCTCYMEYIAEYDHSGIWAVLDPFCNNPMLHNWGIHDRRKF